jgi:hypothetical protein
LKFFELQSGAEEVNRYFENTKIDPDFFTVYDNQLNARFNIDLVTCMIERGALTKDRVPAMAKLLVQPSMHGRLHQEYASLATRSDLIRTLIRNIQRYETNFNYTITDERRGAIFLTIKPSSKMKHFRYKNETLGSFFCDWKKQYLIWFSTYLAADPVTISEHECHYRGKDQCVYEVHLA